MNSATTNNSSILKWLMPIIVGVVVIGLGYWWILNPLINPAGVEAEEENLKNSISRGQDNLAALKIIQDEYAKVNEADRTKLALVVPQGEDMPNLLAQLDGIFKNSGFNLKNINVTGGLDATTVVPPTAHRSDELRALQISVTLSGGSYDNLKKLIADTEQSIKILKLTSFTFGTGASGGDYLLNFTTPYLP